VADGKTIVSAAVDGHVCLWNAATGKPLREFHVADNLRPLDLSADGKILAMSARGASGCVLVDVATGKVLGKWETKAFGLVGRAAFSPDGRMLAVAAYPAVKVDPTSGRFGMIISWTLRLLDAATAKEIHNFGDDLCRIDRLFFSRDGKRLVASCKQDSYMFGGLAPRHKSEGTHVWDVVTRQKQHELKDVDWALFFLPDNRTLAAGLGNWNWPSGLALHDTAGVRPQQWLPVSIDAKFKAVCRTGNQVVHEYWVQGEKTILTLRDADTGKRLLQWQLARQWCSLRTVDFSPDGNFLATGAADTTVLVWDLRAMLRAKPEPVALQAQELPKLWADLSSTDENIAVDAIDRLVENPMAALALLKQHVKPLPNAELQRWLADLDSDAYAKREKAASELARLEFGAAKPLKDLLEKKPSLELRLRVDLLLKKLEEPIVSKHFQASWRTVVVLAQIGTPEARAFLEALSKGIAGARLTQLARVALERMPEKG
jgi:hypothetical protein